MIVPVDEVNLAMLQTVDYARTHLAERDGAARHRRRGVGQRLRARWEAAVLDVPLLIISSPYRSFVVPIISYLDALDQRRSGAVRHRRAAGVPHAVAVAGLAAQPVRAAAAQRPARPAEHGGGRRPVPPGRAGGYSAVGDGRERRIFWI